jgi:hypothetical protein
MLQQGDLARGQHYEQRAPITLGRLCGLEPVHELLGARASVPH